MKSRWISALILKTTPTIHLRILSLDSPSLVRYLRSPASWKSLPMSSSSSSPTDDRQIVVDPFCFRQFSEHNESSKKAYKGTVFEDVTVQQMEDIVNQYYNNDESKLVDGYAPFCKHLFVENNGITESAKVNVLKITAQNQHLLRTEYQARNEKELPVLVRYFPMEILQKEDVKLPTAKILDFILYSREQIQKENAAQGNLDDNDKNHGANQIAPWGIVSIKAQDVAKELPMTPITVMRNALGKEEGGSGVPLNRTEYMAAVQYWSEHATIG